MLSRKKMSENVAPLGLDLGPSKGQALDGPVKGVQGKVKRTAALGQVKRSALGDINVNKESINIIDGKKKLPIATKKSTAVSKLPSALPVKAAAKPAVTAKPVLQAKKKLAVKKDVEQVHLALPQKKTRSAVARDACAVVQRDVRDTDREEIQFEDPTLLDRVEEDISVIEDDDVPSFDVENYNDVFHVGIYAQDIFNYYKNREKLFQIPKYTINREHPIPPFMRAILVDWMVETQESFELNHETLYLGVKLTDIYMSRTSITKNSLQLLGAVSLFIASKFDEQRYPLIEDFTYVCDNAFDSEQFLEMEMNVLRRVDFDLGIPISYRFLRRYAKVARLSNKTLTLARFILEMSLMEAEFISERDSKIAAAACYLAMKMVKEGAWEGDVVKSSGYVMADFKAILIGLNNMLLAPPNSQLTVIRSKYSHSVFHEVAKIPTLKTESVLL